MEKIAASSICNICFGRDASRDTLEWNYFDPEDETWTLKIVTLRVAVRNILKLCAEKLYRDMSGPLTALPKILIDIGLETNISTFDHNLWENQ